MKLIIDIPEEIYESQRYAQYFGAWSVVLQKHFENSTPIPDNATNGEVIKAMFPHEDVYKGEFGYDLGGCTIDFDWWNAPYQLDVHCSECGFKYAYTTDKEDSIPTNYCPNCGVHMKGANR